MNIRGMHRHLLFGKHNDWVSRKVIMLLIAICLVQLGFENNLKAQIANGKCKFLGNIISSSVPSSYATYWNQITPENGGKWGAVQSNDSTKYNWTDLDLAYNTAKTNGYLFKQHNFVWGQQQPSFLTGLSDPDIAASVERWIRKYGQKYPNTDLIDVVNEPINTVPSYISALGGAGTTGYDWIVWAFEKARKYCPNAKLLINEYGVISNDAKTDQYIAIIQILKSKGLIDGIGEQGHFWETTPISTITSNLNKLAALGLPIYISEYDVNLADDAQQLTKYQEQIPVLWGNTMVKGITLWGYIQNQIWRTSAYLLTTSGAERPALGWLKTYIPGATCLYTSTNDISTNQEGGVYPNPTIDGKFSVNLTNDDTSVSVIDLNGRILKSVKVSGEPKIDLLIAQPGVYIVKITSSNSVVTKKLMVK